MRGGKVDLIIDDDPWLFGDGLADDPLPRADAALPILTPKQKNAAHART